MNQNFAFCGVILYQQALLAKPRVNTSSTKAFGKKNFCARRDAK